MTRPSIAIVPVTFEITIVCGPRGAQGEPFSRRGLARFAAGAHRLASRRWPSGKERCDAKAVRNSLTLGAALAGGVVLWMAAPAAAGPVVDPGTL
jgi:hypothetical protein